MNNFYINFDKHNMTLLYTDKSAEQNSILKIKFLESYVATGIKIVDGEIKENQIYAYFIDENENLNDGFNSINEISDFDIINILKKIILVKNKSDKDYVKSTFKNSYCVLIDDIDNEIKKVVKLYRII